MKYSFTMSWEDINKGAIASGKSSQRVKDNIHKMCVSVLHRWSETKDVSTAAAVAGHLVSNVDGYYRQAIINWFAVYAAFTWDKEVETFSYSSTKTKIDKEEVIVAKQENFEKVSPPKKPEPAFDFRAQLQALINRADKKREKGLREGTDDVPAELLKAAKALIA